MSSEAEVQGQGSEVNGQMSRVNVKGQRAEAKEQEWASKSNRVATTDLGVICEYWLSVRAVVSPRIRAIDGVRVTILCVCAS